MKTREIRPRWRGFLGIALPIVVIGASLTQLPDGSETLRIRAREMPRTRPGLHQAETGSRTSPAPEPVRLRSGSPEAPADGAVAGAGRETRLAGQTSPDVESLGLTGRVAFTATDKPPVEHWSNGCGEDACFAESPSEIKVMDLGTGRVSALTSSPLFEQGSSWSPDGSKLAYSVARGETGPLYTIKADGSGNRQIVWVEGKMARKPTWSPDGRRLAFALESKSSPFGTTTLGYEVWMVNADGTGLHRIDEISGESYPTNPAWSPDGRNLAYVTRDSAWVPSINVLDLATKKKVFFEPGERAAWAPDGKRMAVSRGGGYLTVIDVPSGEEIRGIQHADGLIGDPAWSPDGEWIAFTSTDWTTPGDALREIWVVRSNGENMKAVVRGPQNYWAPTWAVASR